MADTDLLLVVTQITFRDAACTSLRLEMQHCSIGVGQGAKTGAQVGGEVSWARASSCATSDSNGSVHPMSPGIDLQHEASSGQVGQRLMGVLSAANRGACQCEKGATKAQDGDVSGIGGFS